MKRKAFALLGLAAVVGLLSAGAASAKQTKQTDVPISGSGSSLVNPLVQQFIPAVGSAFGYSLSYASVGSGTGIANITARTYDFGASDAPLNTTQASACGGCIEIPWALSATTLSYNITGVPNQIHLDGPTIVGIFLGHDHELERPDDRQAEPEADDAEPRDHPGASLGRIRRHLRVHRLPREDQPELREHASVSTPRPTGRAVSARAQAVMRESPASSRARRAPSATSARPTRSRST